MIAITVRCDHAVQHRDAATMKTQCNNKQRRTTRAAQPRVLPDHAEAFTNGWGMIRTDLNKVVPVW